MADTGLLSRNTGMPEEIESGEAHKSRCLFKDSPEKGSKFLLASIGLNIETGDIYLIRVRKMPAVAINGSSTGRRPE